MNPTIKTMEKITQHIRFGVICRGTSLPSWQKTVLEKLILETDIELKLVIFQGNQQHEKQTAVSSSSLWNLYYRQRVQKKSAVLQFIFCNECLIIISFFCAYYTIY